jgi:hypothetical protein
MNETDDYLFATEALVEAKVRYAEAFIRFRIGRDRTDGQAAHMAYVETKGAVDLAEARQYVARRNLDRSA